MGLVAWRVGQGPVTAGAAQIATPALAGRKTISIKALAANSAPVYIGQDNTVTTANGYELAAGDSVDMEVADVAADGVTAIQVWVIAAAGQRVCWVEVA